MTVQAQLNTKSSSEEVSYGNINIQKVTAAGSSASAKLDASLRVAITIEDSTYIYAPVSGATLKYNVNGDESETNATDATGIVNTITTESIIPVNTTDEPV